MNLPEVLTPFKYYKLKFTTGKIKMSEVTDQEITADTVWIHFKTGPLDLPGPPQITSYLPANGSTNVANNSNIVINFNESVVLGAGKIILRESPGGTIIEEFVSGDGKTSVIGDSQNQISLNPASDFGGLINLYLEFQGNTVKDHSNNYLSLIHI